MLRTGSSLGVCLVVGLVAFAGCDPTGTRRDESPVVQRGEIIGTNPGGGEIEYGSVLQAALFRFGFGFDAEVSFALPYECETYTRTSSATYRLRIGPHSFPVSAAAVECMTAGVGTDIRIPIPDIEALLDVAEYDGRYATIEIEIADDGIADRVEADGTEVHASGVTSYRFFVIHDSGGTPTPIHVVNVGPDRSAPGWDRRVTPAERDVYLAPAPGPLEVALPLMAHELLEMRTDGPMVSFSASDALDDFEGIAWQSGGAGAPIGDPHAPTAPFSRVFTATDVGFVPGQLYEIDLTGRERGLATDLIAVQSQTGGFLEPWADAALAGDDELRKHDSRFVFRVYPIRIERPNQTLIRGRTSVGLPAGPAPMPATVPVPLELLSPRAGLGEAVFADAHVRLAGALIGTLHTPFTHPASPSVLRQSDAEYDIDAYLVPVTTATATLPTTDEVELDLEVILTDASGAKVVARDRRRGRLDLTVPTLPTGICAPGASTGCLVVEDDDERDCRIGRVCVDASTDAVALDMTYCGTTRTVRLAREGALMCARDVTFIGTREGSASSRPFTATAVDDAGNRSAPGAYDQAAACPLPPGRFAGGATTAAAHVRGAAGPIAMTASGGSLVVSTWNGRAWTTLLVHTPSGGPWIFRGRADGITLSDGSALFCATRRHPSTFDFFDVGDDMLETGILDLVHVPAGGGPPRVVRIADVAALGCALDQSPTGSRQVGVAYAERVFSSSPADVPIRAALTECALDASGLACTASAAFRATATREGLMGLDIDLAYSSAGAPFAVGRGRRAPDGTVTEHAVYLVRGGISVVTLQSQTRAYECIRPRVDPLDAIVPDSWFDASVTMVPPERTITLATGALTPRIVRESTGRFGVTMTRYEQSAVVRDQSDRMTAETETRFEAVAMLIAASGALVPGSSRSLGLQHLSDSPPSLLWAYGDFALPRPGTAGLCGVPSSDADVPSAPPTDLEGDGRTAVAVWAIRNVATARQRPELRISDRLFAIRGREIENGPTAALRGFSHSSSLQRTTIPLLPGTAFAPTTALLDAEVGNRNQIADLALGRGASAISSPSAFYDRWSPSDDTGRDFFHDMLYAEARAGQFLVGPDGPASPGAEDSCVANLMSVVPVTDSQLLLVPEPPPIDPPTPQYPWTSMQMGLAALNANFANTSAGLTCQVNQLVESTLGAGAVNDLAFDIPVQTNVVQPLLSFATTLGGSTTTMRTPTTPAMLLSNRFDLATATLGPGTLTLVVNGTALPAVSLPGPTPIVVAVDALNTALGAAPGRPFVALAPIGPDPRTPVAARVALLAYPTGSAEATLSVRPGGIATRLGVPIGPVARSSRQIDIAFGDTSDRFRPCAEWTPCTPGPRGTCSLAEDCIPTGTSLLAEVLEGVRLREGRVPLRSQFDVCVPTTQLAAPNADACEPGGPAYRGGIASSYVSQSISGRDGCRTAAGEGAAGGRCLTCGRPAPASSTDPLDRAGAPRRCSTDDDCQPSRTCTARSCPATTNMLCTHMDGIYMGVPAGEGFCASPASCSIGTADCIAREGLPATRGILGVASGAFPRPVDPRRAFIVEGVVHAIGDFRPGLPTASGGGVECTLHGCAACIGDEVNGYCRSDAECPPDHSCLTRARGASAPPNGTPLCVLRPLLEDGRLRRAETELATTTDPGVAELANTVLPALAGVRAQIASSASALRVPLRFAFDVDVLGEVRIDRVEAEIAQAVAAWHDVPVVAPEGYSYGSSQLWMTIGIQDDIRVAGRTRLGPLTARFNVAAIQLRFAPYVGSDHHLAMRLVGARMLREFDEHSLEIEPSALDLNFEGEFRANLFGALFILKSLFTFAAVPGAVAVFDEVVSSLEEGLDLSILTQVGLGELGGFIAPVIERTGQDLVFGTLFGAETIAAPTSLLENAWAHSSPGSLDLRFRGPVINLRGLITGLAIAPVTSPVGACCQARDFDRTPEPDPNCLQAGGTVAACVAAQVAACGP